MTFTQKAYDCTFLKDASNQNLVQTSEHVPAIVHGGPFANIAHGCNSVTAKDGYEAC